MDNEKVSMEIINIGKPFKFNKNSLRYKTIKYREKNYVKFNFSNATRKLEGYLWLSAIQSQIQRAVVDGQFRCSLHGAKELNTETIQFILQELKDLDVVIKDDALMISWE